MSLQNRTDDELGFSQQPVVPPQITTTPVEKVDQQPQQTLSKKDLMTYFNIEKTDLVLKKMLERMSLHCLF